MIVGAAIAFGAITQRRVGGLVFLGLLLLTAFSLAAITPVSVGSGVGEKNEQPTTVTALDPSYEHGIGELDLDLSSVTLPGTTSVDASVGIGKLVVTVPADIAVVIDATPGSARSTSSAPATTASTQIASSVPGSTADAPVLDLEADIAIGDIEVRRG